MIAKSSQGGHSATVNMRLLVGEASVPVVQLGPDFLLVNAAFDVPPGEASVVLQVDQSERRWKVRLPHGVSSASRRVAIVANA